MMEILRGIFNFGDWNYFAFNLMGFIGIAAMILFIKLNWKSNK
jgi:hypothetical protein